MAAKSAFADVKWWGIEMGILTDDMKRLVREQKLGFWATVSPDGTPNLSPKGTTAVWDDDHLFCADIRSPRTVANIRSGSHVEINVVDPIVRKGYRFKGAAVIHNAGTQLHGEGLKRLRKAGFTTAPDRIRSIVVVGVKSARPLVSPAYDNGTIEAEIVRAWSQHFAGLQPTLNLRDGVASDRVISDATD